MRRREWIPMEADVAELLLAEAKEEVQKFHTIDHTLVLLLQSVACEQEQSHNKRIIEYAAEVLEQIAAKGYSRPPKIQSRRQRLRTTRLIDYAWAMKGKDETVEDFCVRVARVRGVSFSTVWNRRYRNGGSHLFKKLRKIAE